MTSTSQQFFSSLRERLGPEAVDTAPETLARYGANLLPGGDRLPSGVVYPGSTEEVQTVVRAANTHGVKLWPLSTGENRGLGYKSPVRPGQVVVDLGRRMNRIVEINESLAYAVVEPGVTYAQMYEELGRRGHKLMMDTTSGPPEGGILGNTLEKGAGYSPYFDHFGMSCGYEVVLPTGEVVRTSDGALPGSQTQYLSKYGYGPFLDGLFIQSNLGIVTRMGVWLMPRPPVVRSFFFSFPDDEDLGDIFELVRPIKLNNVVPTLLKVTGDLYAVGTEETYPFGRTGGRTPLSAELRKELREKHGLGAWIVSGAFYGATEEAVQPLIERVKAHFLKSGKARYISHAEAEKSRILKIHIDTFSGQPTRDELGLLRWRPGGGAAWFLPATPMVGRVANEHQALSRRILAEHGFDLILEYACGPRMSRALHLLIFNRQESEERQRAGRCMRALIQAYADAGYPVARAPIDVQDEVMARLQGVPEVLSRIKKALDPQGILAPGKYGIE
ncbi:FAD-binding oxidoreductase [Hyalangium rubrum]|uniref:FAD-binding oxidoreductase n=1 Tax=Hyalangium rubrum TaxID=3103134 RepID=A0ABU5GUS2_9BACT|nr:FAD-binding oxidoreductase [Hyalangium sp. s54d21]MDY7224930.1 FAD-binding oxidoreductase [Hyalangium sp. s54d21]